MVDFEPVVINMCTLSEQKMGLMQLKFCRAHHVGDEHLHSGRY